jgi:hypothetical protein
VPKNAVALNDGNTESPPPKQYIYNLNAYNSHINNDGVLYLSGTGVEYS